MQLVMISGEAERRAEAEVEAYAEAYAEALSKRKIKTVAKLLFEWYR